MTPAGGRGARPLRSPRVLPRLVLDIRRSLPWYAFVVPPFGLFLLFVAYPTYESFRLSLFRQVGQGQEFAGLYQYTRLAGNDVFMGALTNTALLGLVFLAIVIPLATVVASLINSLDRFATPLKVVYFLPQITSSVAVAIVFNYIFQPDWGLLNTFLRSTGVDPLPLWLADPGYTLTGSRAAVTILAVWMGLGYFVLILLAGLQTIPTELYDAASIDGASHLQSWRYITLPSLRPTFVFLLMTGTIDAMARFGDLWTLGGPGGSPARSLQSVVMFMYQTAFEGGDLNLAAATAVIFFLVALGITLIGFRALLAREFVSRRRGALPLPLDTAEAPALGPEPGR